MPVQAAAPPTAKLAFHAVAAAIPVAAALVIGSLAAIPNLGWYETLTKPSFSPPNWLFGPIWTLLYLLVGWAFFRVLRAPDWMPDRPAAIRAFLVQIAIAGAWPIAFFALHSPTIGLAVIVALLAAVWIAGRLLSRVDRAAGLCFLPYGLWVGFAAALNLSIYIKN